MKVVKPYTAVPLEKLDYIRLELRAKLKRLETETGERYKIRTFYLGPRKKARNSRPASTLKSAAYAAKIGIYKVKKVTHTFRGEIWRVTENPQLDRYI